MTGKKQNQIGVTMQDLDVEDIEEQFFATLEIGKEKTNRSKRMVKTNEENDNRAMTNYILILLVCEMELPADFYELLSRSKTFTSLLHMTEDQQKLLEKLYLKQDNKKSISKLWPFYVKFLKEKLKISKR